MIGLRKRKLFIVHCAQMQLPRLPAIEAAARKREPRKGKDGNREIKTQ